MGNLLKLSLGALGVVYGDIGTSPLYAVNEIFFGKANVIHSIQNILGGISLVVWALTIIVAFKYIIFVLRADNDGEGGVFALYGLLSKKKFQLGKIVTILLIFAAGLLYGDGIITPAISVISAVEGLKVVTVAFEPFIIPITIAILTGLFLVQNKGTHRIGSVFGPIIIVWFFSIASLGLAQIIKNPQIIQAFNPMYAIQFLLGHSIKENLLVLGSVMLVFTGGEAMYADMGHFGRKPIRLSWFSMVYPALILNYLGQGAYLLSGNKIVFGNIFYSMVPSIFLIPMVILATMATVIASQALISGAFSLTTQAMAFNLFPFMKVNHTNQEQHGQIYLNAVNWSLYLGTIFLVLTFRSSSNLAGAYGLAVSGVEIMTTICIFFIAQYYWKWSKLNAALLFIPLGMFEIMFLIANSLKIFQGGYVPLAIAIVLLGIMLIWQWGTKIKDSLYRNIRNIKLAELLKIKEAITQSDTIARSSIFLTPRFITNANEDVPIILEIFYNRYKELPKNIIMLSVFIDRDNPHLYDNRYEVINFFEDKKKGSIYSVQVRFGFMEEPNVELVLEDLANNHKMNLDIDPSQWLIHTFHKRILFNEKSSLISKIKLSIYKFLDHNSIKADEYFGLGNKNELTVEVVPMKFHS
ncbi:MAG: KUP/HAK/KT family potassium transporter [Patescibacteria group bacterium]